MGAASDAAALALAKGVTRMMLYLAENEPERFTRKGNMDLLGLALDLEEAQAAEGIELSDPAADDIGKFRADAARSSRDGAIAVFPRSGTQRMAVLEAIAGAGDAGVTDDEIGEILDWSYSKLGPRRRELVEGGWVEDSGRLRESNSGVDVIVWRITEAAREARRESIRSAG